MYVGITTKRTEKEVTLKNLRLENSLKEAKLSSLTSQLNPHFLFNSLNNIRFKIHEAPTVADDMITALSEILRYSLESYDNGKVRLEQELEVVHRYIEVITLHLEERLDFQLTVSPSLYDNLIPPMCLQLLVENAIRHGIENIKERSTLTIESIEHWDSIDIIVRNPTVEKPPHSNRSGIGLANIRQRLQLLYNGRASITTIEDNGYFTATLSLPKEL